MVDLEDVRAAYVSLLKERRILIEAGDYQRWLVVTEALLFLLAEMREHTENVPDVLYVESGESGLIRDACHEQRLQWAREGFSYRLPYVKAG